MYIYPYVKQYIYVMHTHMYIASITLLPALQYALVSDKSVELYRLNRCCSNSSIQGKHHTTCPRPGQAAREHIAAVAATVHGRGPVCPASSVITPPKACL